MQQTPTVRVAIHVRPNAAQTVVGGAYDGALVVRVAEPPEGGRATAAALRAVADALALPRRSVRLVHGDASRRKLLSVTVKDEARSVIEGRVAKLLAGSD